MGLATFKVVVVGEGIDSCSAGFISMDSIVFGIF
jgi:hypothetical protein